MADEIRVTAQLSLQTTAVNFPQVGASKSYDQAAAIAPGPGGVLIETVEEAIDFGDVEPGWTLITNLDDTTFVEFGFSTGNYGFILPAGASCVLKLNDAVTLYAKADTASCQINVMGIND